MSKKIQLCIIGCANKGKSTLFNLLVGKKVAITHNSPGVTVDCRYQETLINGEPMVIADTPGFDECRQLNKNKIDQINQQIENCILESDLIIHIIDAGTGYNHHDKRWAKYYLKQNKTALIAVNMIDKTNGEINTSTYQFSNSDILPISAKTKQGIHALKSTIHEKISHLYRSNTDQQDQQDQQDRPTTICIVGKPNAGKSTLSNKLTGKKISVVAKEAGTTTDTVSSTFKYKNKTYSLLDTAGLRKKSKIRDEVERFSSNQSIESIMKKNTIIIHMIDATQGVSDQDFRMVSVIERARNKHIIVINKWDKLSSDQKNIYKKNMTKIAKHRSYIPILFMSALENKTFSSLFKTLDRLSRQREIPPMSYLTKIVSQITHEHRPPLIQNKEIKIRVCYPTPNRFMSVTIQGKRITKIPASYKKYIENAMQKALNITGIRLEIVFKEDLNPYQT